MEAINNPIETKSLILRPLREEEAESMFNYAQDSEITKFLTGDRHNQLQISNLIFGLPLKNFRVLYIPYL